MPHPPKIIERKTTIRISVSVYWRGWESRGPRAVSLVLAPSRLSSPSAREMRGNGGSPAEKQSGKIGEAFSTSRTPPRRAGLARAAIAGAGPDCGPCALLEVFDGCDWPHWATACGERRQGGVVRPRGGGGEILAVSTVSPSSVHRRYQKLPACRPSSPSSPPRHGPCLLVRPTGNAMHGEVGSFQ